MSIAMVLEATQDWLRQRGEWDHTQCKITDQANPIPRAGNLFIGIDEAGETGGNPLTFSLSETFEIEVAIWRRPSHLTPDMYGDMLVPADHYLPEINTLHVLERTVKKALHFNYDFLKYANEKYGLPDATRGDAFKLHFAWMSTSRHQAYVLDSTKGAAMIGRRLTFRGMTREQKMEGLVG